MHAPQADSNVAARPIWRTLLGSITAVLAVTVLSWDVVAHFLPGNSCHAFILFVLDRIPFALFVIGMVYIVSGVRQQRHMAQEQIEKRVLPLQTHSLGYAITDILIGVVVLLIAVAELFSKN